MTVSALPHTKFLSLKKIMGLVVFLLIAPLIYGFGAPAIPAAGDQIVCEGTNATFSVSGGTTYQWQESTNGGGSWNNISGKTSATLVLTSVSYSMNGYQYRCIIDGVNGAASLLTVNRYPVAAGAIAVVTPVCQGAIGKTYSVPIISNATSYIWTLPSGATISSGSGSASIGVDFSASAASGYIYVKGHNAECGDGASSNAYISVNPLPAAAGAIGGNFSICPMDYGEVYHLLTPIANATEYTWTVPLGSDIIAGATTSSITVNYFSDPHSGNITVAGKNACGTGAVFTQPITVTSLPGAAGTIDGLANVCQETTGVVYTVPEISNVVDYHWSLPTGATISGADNTRSITVNFSATAISGNITVYGSNGCGNGAKSADFPLVINPKPGTPGTITGPAASSVCQGSNNLAYSVPDITNATSYIWAYSGTGATINVGSTGNVTINYSASATSGDLTVMGRNDCGDGAVSSIYTVNVNPLPGAAGIISGPADGSVCQGTTLTYTIPAISNATSYIWAYSGLGASLTWINETLTITFAADATNGDLTVFGRNQCGDGAIRTKAISLNLLPGAPGPISGPSVNPPAVCQGENNVNFAVPLILGADANDGGYKWHYTGTGATISSTTISGGTASVTISFSSNASSGNLTVTGHNSCGDGMSSAPYALIVNPLPLAAGTISSTNGATVCAGQTGVVYTVPSVPNASSYKWEYSGTNVSIVYNNSRTATISFGNSATSGSLTVYAFNDCGNGEVSAPFPINVITSQLAPAVFAGSNGSICESDPFYYINDATATEYLSLSWTHNGTGNMTNETTLKPTYFPSAADISVGSVKFTLTVIPKSPCTTQVIRTQTLTIQKNPIVHAGIDAQICNDGVYTTSSAIVSNASSTKWTSSGDGTFLNDLQVVTTFRPGSDDIAHGGVTLTLIAYGVTPCSTPVTDSFFLEILPYPTAYAGPAGSVCAKSSFTISGATATHYSALEWTSSGTGTFSDKSVLLATYSPSDADILAGNVTLTLKAKSISPPCSIDATSQMVLTINPIADIDAGPDAIACHTGGYVVNGSVATNVATYAWRTNGTGIFTNANQLHPTYTPSAEDITAGSVILTVKATSNSGCTATSEDSMVLTITPVTLVYAGPAGSTCGNSGFTLSMATQSHAAGLLWSTSGNGVFTSTTALNPTYIPSANDIQFGSVTLTLTGISGTSCSSNPTSSMVLTIASPATAYAGANTTICENGVYINSDATAVNAVSINWTTNGTGTFINGNLVRPTYTPSIADIQKGSVVLTLHATGVVPCASATSDVTLTFLPKPTASAGPDENVCAGSNFSLTLATAPNSSSVLWSTSGNGSFSNPSILLPTYTPSAADIAAGHVHLTITAQPISPCLGTTTDELILTFIPPVIISAGPPQTICQTQTSFTVSGFSASNNSGLSWTTSGTGQFVSGTTLTPTYMPSAVDIATGSVTLTLKAKGTVPCADATTSMVLTIAHLPVISAGVSASVCEGNSFTVGDASALYYSALLWTYNGLGTLSNQTTLTPTYTPASGETGIVTLTLTADATAQCSGQVIATKMLTIQAAPTAYAGANASICQPNSYKLLGASATNASSLLWTTSGTGFFSSNNSLSPTYQPSLSDFSIGRVTLTLHANGINPCNSPAISSMVLTLIPSPTANAGLDGTVCKEGTYTVSGASVTNAISYRWTTSGLGSLINNINSLTPSYTAAVGETGTVILTLTALSNSSCALSVTDQMVITIQSPPTANAGSNASSCEGVAYSLSGVVTNADSFTWSTNGSGNFTGTNSLTPKYTPSAADAVTGSVSFTLTALATSPCSANATNTMTLQVIPKPVVSAGVDFTICESDTYTLSTSSSIHAASILWSTSGDGTFSNAGDEHPVYTPGTSDIANGQARLTLTAQPNPSCSTPVSDFMVLLINKLPTADAGPASVSICKESYTLSGASAFNYSSISWISSGTGTITNTNSLSPTYSPSIADINLGYVTLTMRVNALSPCTGFVTDQIVLMIKPAAPVISVVGGASTTFCQGEGITLTGAPAGYNYQWTPNGATSQNNSVTTSGNYQVIITDPVTGCSSPPSNSIPVTVNPAPYAPVSIGYITQCWNGVGSPATLDARTITSVPPTATIVWYDAAIGGNVVLSTLVTLNTVGTKTFYAAAQDNSTNCVSLTRTPVKLTISTNPATPVKGTDTGSDITACESLTGTTITAISSPPAGITLNWYTSPTGGLPVSPTLSSVGTRTYYAEASNGTCVSSGRSAGVVLTITPAPLPPVSGGDVTQCINGNPQTLTAIATLPAGLPAGSTIVWFDLPVDGNVVPSPPTLSSVGIKTYYAESRNFLTNCTSLTRTPVTLELKAHPAPPVVSDIVECERSPLQTLTAFGYVPQGSTIKWYNSAIGGVQVTPTLHAINSVTYYAETDNGICVSSTRSPVTLTINPAPAPATSFGTASKCAETTIIPLYAHATASGASTIRWYTSPTGGAPLVLPAGTEPFLDHVGTVTYYAEAFDGTCTSLTRSAPVVLTINPTPAKPVTLLPEDTQCESNPSRTLTATATATGATINWYNAAIGGAIVSSPTLSNPGTVTYYAEAVIGSCNSPLPRTAVKLTINPAPAPPVTSKTEISECDNGQTIIATATVSSGETLIWFTAATGGVAVATPTQTGAGSTTYYAEARNSLTDCRSLTRTAVKLTISGTPLPPVPGIPDPANPSVGVLRECATNPLQTLTATATSPEGYDIKWYRQSAGGAPISSPTLNSIGTIDYYAEAASPTCGSSTRVKFTLEIYAVPTAPTALPTLVMCASDTRIATGDFSSRITPAAGYGVEWFNGQNDLVPLDHTPTFAILQPGTTTYYAGSINQVTGCRSLPTVRTAVKVTINPTPNDPVSLNNGNNGNITECVKTPIQVIRATVEAPTDGSTIVWYDAAVGGNIVTNPTLNFIGTKFYWAEAKLGTCVSKIRTQVKLTLVALPTAPKLLNTNKVTLCESELPYLLSKTLQPIDTATFKYKWYDQNGGAVSDSLKTTGESILFAETFNKTTGCSSSRIQVTVTVLTAPISPALTGKDTINECALIPLQKLDANNGIRAVTGMKVYWYTDKELTAVIDTPTWKVVGVPKTYYSIFENTTTKCRSLKPTAVTLLISDVTAHAISNSPVQAGQEIRLNGGPKDASYSYLWTTPGGITYPTQDMSIPTAVGTDAGWYKLKVTTSLGCTSTDSTKVFVGAGTADYQQPVCVGGTLYLLGWPDNMKSYAWTGPDGFISADQNPYINNVTLMKAGTYTLTVTDASGKVTTGTVDVIIHSLPEPLLDANVPVCKGSTLQLKGGPDGMVTYLWKGQNGAVINTNTTLPDTSIPNYSTGPETFTLTVIDKFGCEATKSIETSYFKPKVSFQPVCVNDTLRLKGEPSGMRSYTWSDPNSTIISSLQSPMIIGAKLPGKYTLTVVDQSGCIASADTNVVFKALPPTPMITASMNPICAGNNLTLSGEPPGMIKYLWTGPNGFNFDVQNPPTINEVTKVNAGLYTLKITNSSGCSATSPITIIVNSATFNGTYGPYCVNDAPVTLSATPSGGTFIGQGIVGANANIFDPRTAGVGSHHIIYNYTLTNTSGSCDIRQPIDIIVTDSKNMIQTNTVILATCTGSTADLTLPAVTEGSAPGLVFTYWKDAAGKVPLPLPNSVGAGIYYIKGATPSGKCFEIQPVLVGQPDLLKATLTPSPELKCAGDTTGTLTVDVTLGTAPYTYQWSTKPSQTTATAVNLRAGIYTVVVSDASGCTSSFTGEIKEPDPIKLGFEIKPVQCLSDVNGSARVDTINGSTDVNILNSYNYRWATNPVQTTREAVRLSSLWHTVTLTNANGCIHKDSVFVKVLDITPPTITCPKDIDLTLQYIKSDDGSPNKYTIDLGKPVAWDNCAVDTITNDSPVKFRTGLTYVIWTVADQVGLLDTCTQRISIKEIPIIPQLISPNGDGVNDKLLIDGLEQFPNTQLLIFTRSGQLVFQSDNYELQQNAWDGKYSESTFNKNSLVAPGVYYYILKLGGASGQSLKGYVYVYY